MFGELFDFVGEEAEGELGGGGRGVLRAVGEEALAAEAESGAAIVNEGGFVRARGEVGRFKGLAEEPKEVGGGPVITLQDGPGFDDDAVEGLSGPGARGERCGGGFAEDGPFR